MLGVDRRSIPGETLLRQAAVHEPYFKRFRKAGLATVGDTDLYKPFLTSANAWIDWTSSSVTGKIRAPFYICPSESRWSDAEDSDGLRRSYFAVTGGKTKLPLVKSHLDGSWHNMLLPL